MEHLTHWKINSTMTIWVHTLCPMEGHRTNHQRDKKEMVTGANGQKSECFVAYFHENVKPMILNKTNCKAIERCTRHRTLKNG